MATTAQDIFDMAIYMMDEQNEATGETDTSDTAEYKLRTLGILNVLRHEVYPYSDTYKQTGPGRPICPEIVDFVTPVALDDAIAQGVLPYGLAYHLLLGENDTMADFFAQRYQEALAQQKALPAEFEEIPLSYGGCGI